MPNSNIFLSYCWKNQKEVDILDADLRNVGINIIRDIRTLTYKSSIKEFMRSVTSYDYVILFLTDDFLRSESCMYEVEEIFRDKNFNSKILPIVLPSHIFLKPEMRLEYIKFWENKTIELNKKIKNIDVLVNVNSSIEELNHYNNIRSSIDYVIRSIYDLNCLTFSQLKNQKYKALFDYIGFSKTEIIEEIIRIKELDLEEQEIQILELLRQYPNNEDVLYYHMVLAIKQSKYELAEKRCEYYLDQFPDSAKAHNNYSIILKRVRTKFEKAKYHAEKAIALDPNQPIYKFNLGNLYLENLDDPKEAEKCYKDAISISPNYFNALESLGYVYEFKYKDLPSAEKFYLAALESNPTSELIYHRLANFYARQNNLEKAEIYFTKLLEINPGSKKGHCNFGIFLYDQKRDYDKAKLHYERAIEIDSYYGKAHYNYALLMLYNYQDFEKAEKHLKIAGMFDEEYKGVSFKSNIELLKSVAIKKKELLENNYNLPALSPEFPEALLKLTVAISQTPIDWVEIKGILLEILTIHPKYDWARLFLMDILRKVLGEYDQAFNHFLILLENNNDNAEMHSEVSSIYISNYKNYKKGSEHLLKAIELDSSNASFHLRLSILYLSKLFEPDLAKNYYLKACDLDKKCMMKELDEIFEISRA